MCCEMAHKCTCGWQREVSSKPKCIRCGDPITDGLMCIECEEGKQWPAS